MTTKKHAKTGHYKWYVVEREHQLNMIKILENITIKMLNIFSGKITATRKSVLSILPFKKRMRTTIAKN